jgi:chromosome segregation ATPase
MNQPTNNGTGKPAAVPAVTLPTFRMDMMRASNEYHQQREHILEETTRELDEARIVIRELETEIEALKRERVMLESRATSCLLQRDQAKDSQVELCTVINSIQRLITGMGIPTLAEQAQIRQQPEEEAGG